MLSIIIRFKMFRLLVLQSLHLFNYFQYLSILHMSLKPHYLSRNLRTFFFHLLVIESLVYRHDHLNPFKPYRTRLIHTDARNTYKDNSPSQFDVSAASHLSQFAEARRCGTIARHFVLQNSVHLIKNKPYVKCSVCFKRLRS